MTSEELPLSVDGPHKTNPIVSVSDPLRFNRGILKARIHQFLDTDEVTGDSLFYDRGIPDVIAYMTCFGQQVGEEFIQACKTYRYDAVFLMPPWKEIHKSDAQRFETFREAETVHGFLEATYRDLGYAVVTVPKAPVQERIDFILQNLPS